MTHPRRRPRAVGGALALAGALHAGCFRDGGAPQLCDGAACGLTGGGSSTGVDVTGSPPTTGGDSTTGATVDRSITFRLDTMSFVDPHLFLSDPGDDATTGGTTGGTPGTCTNDVTTFVNQTLKGDVDDGSFSLIARFTDFGVIDEMRLFDGDCEDPVEPGGRRVCSQNPKAQAVLLTTEALGAGGCSQLDPARYQPINAPLIHAPQGPCVRTREFDFSVPVSDSVGSLNLRDAQFSARLDDPAAPQRLEDGVLYGFLPKAVAEDLVIDAPLFGAVNLWDTIDSPACEAMYPAYLPSIDTFEINDAKVLGVWIAINFTAERVDYIGP